MSHQNLFRKAGALALSAGISVVAGDMGVGLLIKLLTEIGGKYLENLDYDQIRAALRATHPADLNHHLQKALRESVAHALKNIEVLYADKLPAKPQKQAVRELTATLQTAVAAQLLAYHDPTDQGVVSLIDDVATQSADQLMQVLDTTVQELPVIDAENPYPDFFRQQFVPQLQLCFGEALKKPANHEAWVAYQRLLSKQLKKQVQETVRLGQETNQKLDQLTQQQPVSLPRVSKARLEALRELVETLDKTDIRLEDRFKIALDGMVSDLSTKMDRVVERTEQTHRSVEELRDQASRAQTRLEQFSQELGKNWVSTHAAALLMGLVLLLVSGVGLYAYIRSQPFDTTIFVKPLPSLHLHPDYPPFGAGDLVLQLGTKEERREILSNGEVSFKQIPAQLSGSRVRIKLLTANWQTQDDSVGIGPETKTVFIVPNNRLATVAGSVRNSDGTQGIPGVSITIDDTTVLTNSQGIFRTKLPYHRQRKRYRLTIWKAGFDKQTDNYVPDSSEPEFRLTAN